jgi:hypothetical protein
MFERKITVQAVIKAIENGTVIREYPDDLPYPSRLCLYRMGEQVIHVLAADDKRENMTYIITVYIPDPLVWNKDFTKRTKP